MRIDRIAFVTALVKKDLTCKRVGELTGISRATVTAVKNGKSCSQATGEKLVALLGKEIVQK